MKYTLDDKPFFFFLLHSSIVLCRMKRLIVLISFRKEIVTIQIREKKLQFNRTNSFLMNIQRIQIGYVAICDMLLMLSLRLNFMLESNNDKFYNVKGKTAITSTTRTTKIIINRKI